MEEILVWYFWPLVDILRENSFNYKISDICFEFRDNFQIVFGKEIHSATVTSILRTKCMFKPIQQGV